MSSHCSSKWSSKASNFTFHPQIFNYKFQNGLAIMIATIWVWYAFRPAVISIVPRHNVYFILYEKLQPKSVGRMCLLLVTLSIWVKENYGWVRHVIELFLVCIHFYQGKNLFITTWKKHTINFGSILTINIESAAVKIFL